MSTAPMAVYKEAGKWWFDCRLCNVSNPYWSETHRQAMIRAELHFDGEHICSPFTRAYEARWSRS